VSGHDAIVIGAGAVGASVALELASRGACVRILERGPRPASGCSAGNAGVVGASHVVPLAAPDAVREGLRMLTRRNGPLALNPRPATLPWLARFLRAATPGRYAAGAEVLGELAGESARLHRELGARLDTGYVQQGFLSVFETAHALASAEAHAGPETSLLDGPATRAACSQLLVEPAGALQVADDAHCDPERFVAASVDAAIEHGAELSTGVEVLAIRSRPGGGVSLSTTAGELAAGEVVVAAGAWSPALAGGLPVAVPIQGGKGYHIDYAAAPGDTAFPVYFPERRLVVTPLGERLRISGMLQLAGTDLRVDRGRVETLGEQARELLRGLPERRVLRVWRGLRPCTPDGLPIVGRVPGAERVTLATGHGMWGLQLAPVTGRLVADLLGGTPDERRLAPLRPERFRRLGSIRRGRSCAA
jgi:D-amino-acid dehydrogenase